MLEGLEFSLGTFVASVLGSSVVATALSISFERWFAKRNQEQETDRAIAAKILGAFSETSYQRLCIEGVVEDRRYRASETDELVALANGFSGPAYECLDQKIESKRQALLGAAKELESYLGANRFPVDLGGACFMEFGDNVKEDHRLLKAVRQEISMKLDSLKAAYEDFLRTVKKKLGPEPVLELK